MFFKIPQTDKGKRFIQKMKHLAAKSVRIKEVNITEDEYQLPYYDVKVELNVDWEVIGIINHCDNLIYNFKQDENISLQKYLKKAECESCGYTRQRNTTYIIREIETGDIRQVGTDCLNKFLGYGKAFWDLLAELKTYEGTYSESEDFEGFRSVNRVFYFEKVLETAIILIKNYGYVSKSQEWDGVGVSTANGVISVLTGKVEMDNFKFDINQIQRQAKKVKNFFFNDFQPKNFNDFEHNIYSVIEDAKNNEGIVTIKQIGFIAYMPVMYDSLMEKAEIQKDLGLSEWVGTVKDRVEMELKYFGKHGFFGSFGYVNFYKFYDEDHNCFIWKSTKQEDFVSGDTYKLKFTIKEHSKFKGEKQTLITRAKVL